MQMRGHVLPGSIRAGALRAGPFEAPFVPQGKQGKQVPPLQSTPWPQDASLRRTR
jgi:hypothetical protein